MSAKAGDRATVRNINAILKANGREERVMQGDGYVYFAGGAADGWYTSSVPVCRIGQLTVSRCIDAFNEMAGAAIQVKG